MNFRFLGAARTVTGSMFLVEEKDSKILIDCGLYQSSDSVVDKNKNRLNFELNTLDGLILTHAHIDHSGLIPLIYKKGFRGKTYATGATIDLCRIMLSDSGKLHEEDAIRERKHGNTRAIPLYTMDDAEACMHYFEKVALDEPFQVGDFSCRIIDAGHILGSGTIELKIGQQTVVFSGDIGKLHVPILRDPTSPEKADVLIMESTYGDTIHDEINSTEKRLLEVIKRTMNNGGNVVIPAFSVGRTQHILYNLNHFIERGLLKNICVYVDSPLAVSAMDIYSKHAEYFDAETWRLIKEGDFPFEFPGLKYTHSIEESKAINNVTRNAIIISASGMCTGGRILHHLKHNLKRGECTILFVGYQAEGTLGRTLLDGYKRVKIHGEIIDVHASIEKITGYSAHADQNELIHWIRNIKSTPKKVFVVHGDVQPATIFANRLNTELGLKTVIPGMNETFEILS